MMSFLIMMLFVFQNSLTWFEPSQKFEVFTSDKPYSTKQPNYTYVDVDNQTVRCYYNVSKSKGVKIPSNLTLFSDEAMTQLILDQLVENDLEVDFANNQYTFKMNKKGIVMTTPMVIGVNQFEPLHLSVYSGGRLLNDEEVQKYLAMGAITVSSFSKTTKQEFPETLTPLSNDEDLERERKRLNLPKNEQVIPRNTFFRLPASKAFGSKQMLKSRILDQMNSQNVVLVAEFDEGVCSLNPRKRSLSKIYATCLPSFVNGTYSRLKNRCEVVEIARNQDLCGHRILLGCNRLCQVKQFGEEIFGNFDSEVIVCAK